MRWSIHGQTLISGHSNGNLCFWDVKNLRKPMHEIAGLHTQMIVSVATGLQTGERGLSPYPRPAQSCQVPCSLSYYFHADMGIEESLTVLDCLHMPCTLAKASSLILKIFLFIACKQNGHLHAWEQKFYQGVCASLYSLTDIRVGRDVSHCAHE